MFRFKAQQARLLEGGLAPEVQISPEGVSISSKGAALEDKAAPELPIRKFNLTSGAVAVAHAIVLHAVLYGAGPWPTHL